MPTVPTPDKAAYVEQLQNDLKAWFARHDTPRSEVRPMQDSYSGVLELDNLNK